MTVTAVSPQARARTGATPVKAAGARGVKPVPPAPAPPAPRRRQIALTPMRQDTAKSLRRLAAHVQGSHPDMSVHTHLRDAAKVLESGNEEGAQRHLRAAMFALTPQSLLRNGVHDDPGHLSAREAMHGVHRHLLLVKDITDAGEKNRAAIAKHAAEDMTTSPPPPAYGGDPGALAAKPVARQPGGDRALNAPDRTNSGGSDPAVADPVGPQPRGSKQFSHSWDDLAAVVGAIDLAARNGVHIPGTDYNWKHTYIPLTEAAARSHGHGKVPKGWSAATRAGASAKAHATASATARRTSAEHVKTPPDRITGPDGTMAMGDWHAGHQAIAQAPLNALPKDRSRYIDGKNVKGAWSDPVWVAKPGGGFGVSARWKSKEQKVAQHEGGKTTYVTHPAMDERVLTPYTGDTSGKAAREAEAQKAKQALQAEADKARQAEAEVRKQQQAAARVQARAEQQRQLVADQQARNEAEAARKAVGADTARAKGIEPGAKVFIDSGPYKGGIGTVEHVGPEGRAQVNHMGRLATLGPGDLHTQPATGDESRRMQAVHESAEAAKRDAAMRQREAEAAQANSRGMDRMMALRGAQRVHLHESTGLTIPDEGQFGLGGAASDFRQATDHLLAGRNAEGIAALDRAIAYKKAELGKVTKAEQSRRDKLQKFRDQVAQATANPKPTLPALARVRGGPSGMTVLDHNGVEHKISLKDGTLTVSRGGKTASAPAGDNPTQTARRLAGQLAGTSLAYGRDELATVVELAATMTKAQAHYRPGGTPGHRCGDCTMIRGDRCTLVEGLIDPGHVCDHFDAAGASLAYGWDDLASVVELSARTAQLEVTPAPRGKPGGPGLYDVKDLQHTPYFQNVVKALIRKRGMPPGRAYAIAYGALRKWSSGGAHTHPEVRAAATGALAGEKAKGAMAKAIHGHATTWDDIGGRIELAAAAAVPGQQIAAGQAAAAAVSPAKSANATAQPRVAPGSPAGGQFAPAGSGGSKPDAHQQHVAHLQHLAAHGTPAQQAAAKALLARMASKPKPAAPKATASKTAKATPPKATGTKAKLTVHQAHMAHVAHLEHIAAHGNPAQRKAAAAVLARMGVKA